MTQYVVVANHDLFGMPVAYRDCDDSVEEVTMLDRATVFQTEAAAKELINQVSTMREYMKVLPLVDAEAMFNGRSVRRVLQKVRADLNIAYDATKHTRDDVFRWWCQATGENVQYEAYATWPEPRQLFTHIVSRVNYYSQDEKKINLTWQIMVTRSSTFDTFKSEIEYVLPTVECFTEDGWLRLPIFDYELCEYDSYDLQMKDNVWRVIGRRYTRSAPVFQGTLEECFNYMKKHRYYE